jgi:hypothetical protein
MTGFPLNRQVSVASTEIKHPGCAIAPVAMPRATSSRHRAVSNDQFGQRPACRLRRVAVGHEPSVHDLGESPRPSNAAMTRPPGTLSAAVRVTVFNNLRSHCSQDFDIVEERVSSPVPEQPPRNDRSAKSEPAALATSYGAMMNDTT